MRRRDFVSGLSVGASSIILTGRVKAASREGTRVSVEQGALEGFQQAGVFKFFGIPYALPPTGARRWQPPQHPVSWTGVRAAKQFGAACLQLAPNPPTFRTALQSEDCLTLNIWSAHPSSAARQPVMVWFHGGGNIVGAGSVTMTDGTELAKLGVTVVTLNYRLGAFGFLNDPAVGSNFATLDHVAALEWVRDNIHAFGGDPDCVTIFGYSAGAVSVRALLQCPAARGLFHRAAIQSSGGELPVVAPAWSAERSREASAQLLKSLGVPDAAAARALPAERVNAAARQLSGTSPRRPGVLRTPLDLAWMPFEDGKVIVPGFLGLGPDVPVLFGGVHNEIRAFLDPADAYSTELLRSMIVELTGPKEGAVTRILDAEGGTIYEKLDRLCTTVIWTEPEFATIRLLENSARRVYAYRFDRLSPSAIRSGRGAAHGADIPYIFGTLATDGSFDQTDLTIARELQHAFVSFARSGVPRKQNGKAWPRLTAAAPRETLIANSVADTPIASDPLVDVVASLRAT